MSKCVQWLRDAIIAVGLLILTATIVHNTLNVAFKIPAEAAETHICR